VPLNYLHLCLDLAFLALLASCLLLLRVIWLHWAIPGGDVGELEILRHMRTRFYRGAWRVSMAAVIVVSAASVVHTVGTGLVAFSRCQSSGCKYFFSDEVFGNLDRIARP
jgi:hypothetical protein